VLERHHTIDPAPSESFAGGKALSNPEPSDLFGSELLAGAVIQLGRPPRFVVGDGLGMFQRPAVLEIGGDAGGAKCMAAGRVGQAGSLGPPLNHVKHVKSRHGLLAQPLAFANAAE
jgi:hypothetical protein